SADVGASWEGGAHPDGSIDLEVVPTDRAGMTGLAFADVLGPASKHAATRGLQEAIGRDAADRGEDSCDVENASDRNWFLARREGRIRALGWADTRRVCGYGFEYELPMDVPRSAGGGRALALPWPTLAARIK